MQETALQDYAINAPILAGRWIIEHAINAPMPEGIGITGPRH